MSKIEKLDNDMTGIVEAVYEKCSFQISHLKIEPESREYAACQFRLNGLYIICRDAKITPKKGGQFVTFWKRNATKTIEPFFESDQIDFFVVNVQTGNSFGQFVFPKSILIKKGIISTNKKEGKRAFRVYPPWDIGQSKQAEQTQKWQLDYFVALTDATDLKRTKELYAAN